MISKMIVRSPWMLAIAAGTVVVLAAVTGGQEPGNLLNARQVEAEEIYSLVYAPVPEEPGKPQVAPEAEEPLPGQPRSEPCLPKPKHFTAQMKLSEGTEIALTRYLRFSTPESRTVFARMFLLEVHPDRARFENVSEELKKKRQTLPARMVAVGHEIAVDEPTEFEPDFDVAPRYVKSAGKCMYEVDLGMVKCFVRTTE